MPGTRRSTAPEDERAHTPAPAALSKADHTSATTTPSPAAEPPPSRSGSGAGKPPRAAAKRPRSVRNALPLDGRDYQPTQVVQSPTGEYSATMLRKAQLLRKIKEHAQSARAAHASGRAGALSPLLGAPMAHGHWDHAFGAPACALLGGASRTAYGGGDGYGYDWHGGGASQPSSSCEGVDALQQQTAHAHGAVVRAHIVYAAQQRLRQQQRRCQDLQDAMAAQPLPELAPGQLLQCAGLDGCAPLPQFALHSPPRTPLPRFDSSSHLHDLGAPTDPPSAVAQLRYQAQPPPARPYHPRAPATPRAAEPPHKLRAPEGGADAAEPETARVRERILQLAHQLVLASSALGRGEPESERVLSTLIRTLRAMPQGAAPARDDECASAGALRLDSPTPALQPTYLLEQISPATSELEPPRGFGSAPSLACFDSRCGGAAAGGDVAGVDGSTIASCALTGAGAAAHDDHTAFDASSPWAVGADNAHARVVSAPTSEPARDGAGRAVAAAAPHRPPRAAAGAPDGALGAFADAQTHVFSGEIEPDDLDELDLMDFSTLARGTSLNASARAPASNDLLSRIGQAFSSQWRAELDASETLLSRPSDEVLDDIISSLNAVA